MCTERGIIVVPLYVHWQGQTWRDGEDMSAAEFYRRLQTERVCPAHPSLRPEHTWICSAGCWPRARKCCASPCPRGSAVQSTALLRHGACWRNRTRWQWWIHWLLPWGRACWCWRPPIWPPGHGLQEIVARLRDRIGRLRSVFTINTLENLVKGGRLSAVQGGLGTLLGIKPVLQLDARGKIVPLTKVRTRKKALAQLVAEVEKQGAGLEGQVMGVSHAHDPETGALMAQLLKERFRAAEVVVGEIGPVIGAHTGQGCIALFFCGRPR